MKKYIPSFIALGLLATLTHAAPAFDQWSGTGPFASGQGNRVVNALAVSADGMNAYAGTGSGTVLRYAYSDTAPDAFSFTAQTGVGLGAVATSNSITVAGVNTGAAISLADGTYSVNGGAYTAAAGSVNNGDTVTVRQTASGSNSTTTTATLTIGGVNGAFDVTTVALVIDATPDAFSFTAQTGVALSAVATSNTITVDGINAASTISIAGGAYSINGGAYTAAAGSVNNGNTVTVRQTASASNSTTTTAMLTIGGVSGVFSVTTVAVGAPTPAPTPTIPPLGVSLGGVIALPGIVNMAAGDGPAFMDELVRMLSSAVGQALQFEAQNAQGTVSLRSYNGGKLAFVPHSFQSGDARANGIYAVGDGQYQVVRNGQSLVIAPALLRLDQLTALLPGVEATLKDSGRIIASYNGQTYVLQPGVAVQLDAASGSAQLVMGSDGFFHFIDAQGNNQVLYPAFGEPTSLRSILQGLDPAATLNIQLDGTALIVFMGQRYTLVPDLTLGGVPAERVGQNQWQEGATRYRLLNVLTAPVYQTTQGFTVKP